MEIFTIPIQDKVILYRPLLRLAFVGNQAMADLTMRLARQRANAGVDAPEEVMTYLDAIGFLRPDPKPPPPPDRSFRPTMAVLLLTSRCNLRCTYCYADGGEGLERNLSLELARTAIDQVYQNALVQGKREFRLSFHGGGEPVQAWETLVEASTYARSKDLSCHISMVTNGVWSQRQRDWVLENLNGVTISFDGIQETQDRQRPFPSGQGSFDAVMRTIRALDEADFSYGIRMTATAPWRDRLAEDVRFICQETGCPAMQVEPAFNSRRGEHQGPTDEESMSFAEAFLSAFDIARSTGRQLTYSGARPWLITQAFCSAPYRALIVNPEGDLVVCYEVTDRDHPLVEMSTVGCLTNSQIQVNDCGSGPGSELLG